MVLHSEHPLCQEYPGSKTLIEYYDNTGDIPSEKYKDAYYEHLKKFVGNIKFIDSRRGWKLIDTEPIEMIL